MKNIAVIGAGLSGLVVARELRNHHAVTIFEKSRGFGGRMATRYEKGFEFDHGAQFFSAKTSDFHRYLQPLIGNGIVANWRARFVELRRGEFISGRDWDETHPHYVGTPRMNEIGKFLAHGLNVYRNTTVGKLERENGYWRLRDDVDKDLGSFDWVILAIPAAQAAALAPENSGLAKLAGSVQMKSCVALMLGFDAPLSLPWQAALIHDADISWIAVNSSKPGRPAPYTLVVHSTNAFADLNLDSDVHELRDRLLAETGDVLGERVDNVDFCRLHRWRYANVDTRDGADFLIDETNQMAACGDWFKCGRVEAAFTSAFGLAGQLLSSTLIDKR